MANWLVESVMLECWSPPTVQTRSINGKAVTGNVQHIFLLCWGSDEIDQAHITDITSMLCCCKPCWFWFFGLYCCRLIVRSIQPGKMFQIGCTLTANSKLYIIQWIPAMEAKYSRTICHRHWSTRWHQLNLKLLWKWNTGLQCVSKCAPAIKAFWNALSLRLLNAVLLEDTLLTLFGWGTTTKANSWLRLNIIIITRILQMSPLIPVEGDG